MTAKYNVCFSDPWQGAVVRGSFERAVKDEDEAIRYQVYYEMKYKEFYDDEFAAVELVSVC